MEYLLSIVTTPGGVGGVALAVGAVAAAVYAPRLAVPAALAACLLGALGYVERLRDDVATLTVKVDAADARALKAEADAKALAATAQADADAAKSLARDNAAQADAYRADAAQARSERDEIDLARQAAAIAADACKVPEPVVGDAVHSALRGRAVSEDDPLAPSMRAAMEALRAKGRRK